MKIVIVFAVLGFLSFNAYAQDNLTSPAAEQETEAVAVPAAQPEAQVQAAVSAPAQPAVQAAPETPAQVTAAPATIEELKKLHKQTLTELKRKQREELRALKNRLKASSWEEKHNAVVAKRKEHRSARKTLKDANKKEMAQFKKDHPVLNTK
ncbi:MAG: hypothetical protein KKH68_05965 [Proteobacteria bacterium]|nr:hypothetical protein [Pseudomonadota bacterium]